MDSYETIDKFLDHPNTLEWITKEEIEVIRETVKNGTLKEFGLKPNSLIFLGESFEAPVEDFLKKYLEETLENEKSNFFEPIPSDTFEDGMSGKTFYYSVYFCGEKVKMNASTKAYLLVEAREPGLREFLLINYSIDV